ncbi:MAG: class I SAM-dependent methyltransferase [Lachnospiraceae bacterium]|nr:class I SAM-dependent methyltransferase [Agathobacter sp.]MDD6291973.1 class I SAM-dependent methyltransferase [Lachnospiraceae bacterium]
MDAYTSFAQVYDMFMDNVPYEQWCAYICAVLKENHITEGPVLDLGCGTGELTRRMAVSGYDLTGVDSSLEMLQIAQEKQTEQGILYLLQEMQELELDGCVRAVYSACDCLNYILEQDELMAVFTQVNQYLEPGGIFLFDVNTDYKYRQLLGEHTFAESRDEGAFIWDNYYDEEEAINQYDLTLFIPEQDGRYRRFTETHFQRNYPLEQIRQMLEMAGFCKVKIFDDYTLQPVRPDSERATFIASRKEN